MQNSIENFLLAPRDNNQSALEKRIEELRETIRGSAPITISEKTGTLYTEIGPHRGEFRLMLWDSTVVVSFPELIAYNSKDTALPTSYQGLLMFYFSQANGLPLSRRWVSFAELPGGRTYAQAFQGYSGEKLVKLFQSDVKRFEKACLEAGGAYIEIGEVSFIFALLPRVPLVVTYHLGEDEFPSSCQILFDSSVDNYLPVDICAITGSMLTGRIINSNKSFRNG
jgi:hypothetical protein